MLSQLFGATVAATINYMAFSGGIAAKNPEWIKSEAFYDAYKNKGRLSPMVESVPLYLVLTEDTGERGALFVAVGMVA